MPEIHCESSFVPNTTMRIFVNSSGNQTQYRFYPDEGYVFHDNRWDGLAEDMETVVERFSTGMSSVSIRYDFNTTTQGTYEGADGVTYNVVKIGEYELYTLPESAVPIANTYGGDNDHEVASTQPEEKPAPITE